MLILNSFPFVDDYEHVSLFTVNVVYNR
ncbi:hypothetical protein XCR1_1540039 [Xenorhabdus cabanillasii JM26]|uniref:Uncharacterized protein n=1 Tax=Xenorhabdus cabanillasii JM26 TaxID=1427517 RepID=W1IPY8_9GAMM|nr:hypothetical protein XCR1_1540039 [Xenorhabdus cabanillasii JM26]